MRSLYRFLMIGPVMLLSACGGGGATPTPAPTVSLTGTLTTIDAGQSTTLTWTSTNAVSCSAAGGWSGTLAPSGSQSTGVLNGDASYSLTCTGPGGTSQTANLAIVVNALPTVQLAAVPAAFPRAARPRSCGVRHMQLPVRRPALGAARWRRVAAKAPVR